MSYNRINRIKSEIKKEVSAAVRNLKDPRIAAMTSVVSADVTRDLKYAKIYVSVMGSDKEKADTMAALGSASGFIRHEIGTKLDIRCIPELKFILDTSIDYGMHINELIHKINEGGGDK